MTETRERIYETVQRDPGIHFNELVRRLDVAPGQVQYHVRRLRRADRIIREPCHGQTHYYPEGFDAHERRAIALLRRETTRALVASILAESTVHPETLAERLDVARSTVEFHLDRLIDADLVDKRRTADRRVRVSVRDPNEIQRFLHATDPPLHHRLADRFERLVDDIAGEF